jgi:hypothetical protein
MAGADARRAFLELSVFDVPDVCLEDVAIALDVDGYRAEAVLDELASLHLLSVERSGAPGDEHRYRLLPSLRAAGRRLRAERAEPALAGLRD